MHITNSTIFASVPTFRRGAKSKAESSLLKLNNMYTSCSSNVAMPLRNRYRITVRFWKQPAAADLKF